jgi:hypothetical protein
LVVDTTRRTATAGVQDTGTERPERGREELAGGAAADLDEAGSVGAEALSQTRRREAQ